MEASFTILCLLFILATTVFNAFTHSLGAAAYMLFGRPRGAGIASVGR